MELIWNISFYATKYQLRAPALYLELELLHRGSTKAALHTRALKVKLAAGRKEVAPRKLLGFELQLIHLSLHAHDTPL